MMVVTVDRRGFSYRNVIVTQNQERLVMSWDKKIRRVFVLSSLIVLPTFAQQPVFRRATPPAPEIMRVLSALTGNQADTNRFFGTWAGTIPIPEFFARENLARIMTAAEKRQGT